MIFLRATNLLVVKPHKTASASVEIALSCMAGDDDIVTPPIPRGRVEALRHGRAHACQPDLAEAQRAPLSARFLNHITPVEIARRGGAAMLRGATLVSMVRHPCEQVLSRAWHQKALRKRDDPVAPRDRPWHRAAFAQPARPVPRPRTRRRDPP